MLQRLNTGVYCNDEQFEELKKLADEAGLELPADLNNGPINYPEGPWVALSQTVHQLALEAGLPEIQGYYGVDDTKQFVTYCEIPNQEESNDEKEKEKTNQ